MMDAIRTENQKPDFNIGRQIAFVVVAGLFLALAISVALLFSYEARTSSVIHTGVKVAGEDLSGLTLGEAVVRLNQKLDYPTQGRITLTDGETSWQFQPANLGYTYDILSSANQAFSVGRTGSLSANLAEQIRAAREGVEIYPAVVYDQRQAFAVLQEISRQVNKPVQEAAIRIDGAEVNVSAGQIGRQVDIAATLRSLEAYLITLQDGSVPLVVKETKPGIMDAQKTADAARAILNGPLTITAAEGQTDLGPWTIEPADLAKLLRVEKMENGGAAEYALGLDRQALTNYLGGIAPSVRRQPENARMMFNDDTGKLELVSSAVIGKTLDVEATVDAVISRVQAGEHQVALVMKDVDPPVKDDTTGASLGITELVAETTSYFWGSAPARVQNIRAAASSFYGVLVAPGEVFSMARYLTDISLENGYAEAIIIVGDQSVKGVGGGVCQVSTTLFRTVFFAGFPIVERYAHAYRVGYYEQMSNGAPDTDLAGLDATVYVPLVDFKFRNDTPYWILMETYATDHSLTWKFYSTSDGRTVDWTTTGVTNVTPPPEPIYREDPTLPAGEIIQVDWAVYGATVDVNRTVYRDNQVYFTYSIHTTYLPWPDGFNYGPGTDLGDRQN